MGYSNKKVVGIWLDHKDAMIISTNDNGNHGDYSVKEKIHNKHHSDHGSNEHTHHHKLSNELHSYYEKISEHVSAFDAILLFGHGNAQEQLSNFLNDHKHFHGKEISVKTGNRLTENEMIAFVRNHFSS
jgi:stalled ribosome rescue protein Dom34